MADIDHFKQINDAIGHDAGDAALRHAARAIAGSLRETDLVARWGGEEFLLLMPDTEEAGASRLLARICDCLASAAPGCAGLSAPLTATFGAAGIRPGESLEKLLRRADQALYRGKAMGRNRVVWDAGDGGENVVL
jgi:diguanylate cyclase (GGDEF)-like protein